jgi:hypothetical protein
MTPAGTWAGQFAVPDSLPAALVVYYTDGDAGVAVKEGETAGAAGKISAAGGTVRAVRCGVSRRYDATTAASIATERGPVR